VQNISIGSKVFFDEQKDSDDFKNSLSESKIEFYTFDLPSQQVAKVMISGLPRIETADILENLTSQGASPNSIKAFNHKNANSNHQLYILYYNKKSDEFKKFKSIRAICKIVFSWRYFKNSKGAVPQCHNCQKFGHASRNCKCAARCMRCAGHHVSSLCPKLDPDTKRIPDNEIKCANCGENHISIFSKCPQRSKFVEIQSNVRQKNSRNQRKQTPDQSSFTTTELSFADSLKLNQTPSLLDMSQFPPINKSINDNVQVKFGNSVSRNSNSDLFTADEIMSIFKELLQRMGSCKSKAEQFQVTLELTTKYLFAENSYE
jgi:hypothetical protein